MNMGKEEGCFKAGHSSTLATIYRYQKCWNKAEAEGGDDGDNRKVEEPKVVR